MLTLATATAPASATATAPALAPGDTSARATHAAHSTFSVHSSRCADSGVVLVQLNNQLWRVTHRGGEVLGYVEEFRATQGLRFRAKRLLVHQRRFLVAGEFWTKREAVDCFMP